MIFITEVIIRLGLTLHSTPLTTEVTITEVTTGETTTILHLTMLLPLITEEVVQMLSTEVTSLMEILLTEAGEETEKVGGKFHQEQTIVDLNKNQITEDTTKQHRPEHKAILGVTRATNTDLTVILVEALIGVVQHHLTQETGAGVLLQVVLPAETEVSVRDNFNV